MEHEVFVPFPVDTVRLALAEPARVARCVPGLQQDADEAAGPLAGRLRLRIGGSTITYRGALRVVRRADAFEVEGEGGEARGSGSVKLALTITPKPVEGGTELNCSGTVHSDGRLAEFDDEAAITVARRMLDRFAAALTAGLETSPIGAPTEDEAPGQAAGEATEETTGETTDAAADAGAAAAADETGLPTEAELPLSADDMDIDDVGDLEDLDEVDAVEEPVGFGELGDLDDLDEEPPAEAAHARRTMIGRSTEEVDHAPPRGRYAPVPAPETVSTSATLRWAAPAAAVVLASVVVVGRRVLRRRR